MMQPLDSDLMRSFLAVADSGSVTAAAARLYRTQSAVSLQVKRLEESLGQPLFERQARGVALTPPVQFTTSANGTAVNNGAATPNGGAAFLHILAAAATDRYTIVVEGSTTGAFAGEQSTLATFTLDAVARDSERVDLAGTLPQYTRWKATRSGAAGDTVEIAVSLIRY